MIEQDQAQDQASDKAHVPGETLHRLVHAYKRSLMNAMVDADMPMPICRYADTDMPIQKGSKNKNI